MRKTKKNTRKLYHYGLTMRIYPSFVQQNTINKNINAFSEGRRKSPSPPYGA
jgi:hypothetical protein